MIRKPHLVFATATVLAFLALAACSDSQSRPTTAVTPAELTTAAPIAEATTAPAADSATEPAAQPAAESIAKLNLNMATPDEFLTVPGVGQRMVREFMEYRPYVSIEQFRREIGKYVDAGQVAEYEKYVYVPVAPNDADAATLAQLPGVDAAIADQLIAGRPYASTEAFVAKLGQLLSPGQAASGAAMVDSQ